MEEMRGVPEVAVVEDKLHLLRGELGHLDLGTDSRAHLPKAA